MVRTVLTLLVATPLVACQKKADKPPEGVSAAATEQSRVAAKAKAKAEGQAKPPFVPPARPSGPPVKLAGAHILIAYKGAMRARPNVTRSKEEALKLAKELAGKAKKSPEKFAELAKQHSSGPSGPRGGDLGMWQKGQMVPAFDQAISGLEVGQVSEPVETPFGYHVMKRNPLPPTYAGAHILIAYKGATRAGPKVKRSKAAALKLAKKLAGKARKAPEKFAGLAKKYSDGPSGPRGGSLGAWPKGRMVPAFDEAIEKLAVGESSDPVETPFGFHVIKREAPPQ